MTGRTSVPTERLIAALGVGVLVLGAVLLWMTTRGTPSFRQEPPSERVLRQAREQLGPNAEVRLIEAGRGRVVCGYVAPGPGRPSFGYVSRPNRLLLSGDPLASEFRIMLAEDCPGFPAPPAVRAVS